MQILSKSLQKTVYIVLFWVTQQLYAAEVKKVYLDFGGVFLSRCSSNGYFCQFNKISDTYLHQRDLLSYEVLWPSLLHVLFLLIPLRGKWSTLLSGLEEIDHECERLNNSKVPHKGEQKIWLKEDRMSMVPMPKAEIQGQKKHKVENWLQTKAM